MITLLHSPTVRVVVCGDADGGDAGVALAAAATLLPTLSADLGSRLEIRRRTTLRVDDLADLRLDERCLIIDAVCGIEPGEIMVVPFDASASWPIAAPRSAHELPLELILSLAAIIRGQSVEGAFVGLGGHRWGYGTPLSRSARAAMPAYRAAIARELSHLAGVDG
ncbi:MAG: hypothetical protein ACSLFN_09725 [Candidatus Limnocylindrales bacterium]